MERINKLLTLIRELWKEHTDLRFFQLLQFIGLDTSCDHFYLEDNIFINMLQNAIDNSPITNKQDVLIKEIESGIRIEFNGKTRKEASEYIAKYLDDYMLRRYDT